MNAKKNLMAFILTVSSIALMVICLGLGMVKACAGGDGSEWKKKVAADTLHVVHYTRPDLPQIMTDPAERAVYYVKHYWDGYLTGDTAWVNSGDTEQLYVDFIDALKYVEPETGRKALHTMMVRMEADSTAYRRFGLLGESISTSRIHRCATKTFTSRYWNRCCNRTDCRNGRRSVRQTD